MKPLLIFLLPILLAVSCTKSESNITQQAQNGLTQKNEGLQKAMSQYMEPQILEIIPGVSLGDISIGESDESLKSKNFEFDKTYSTQDYMRRGSVLARLQSQKVVQIFFGDTDTLKADYGRLVFKGKKFPINKNMANIKKFFEHCEPEVHNIGGALLYCESRKVRISFGTIDKSNPGVSIVLPDDYDSVVSGADDKNIKVPADFKECKSDSDCKAVVVMCSCCEWDAINKKNEAAYLEMEKTAKSLHLLVAAKR